MAEFVFVGPFVVKKGDIPIVPGRVTLLGQISWAGGGSDPYAIPPGINPGGISSGVNYVPVFPQFEAWPAYLQKVILHANATPIVDETGRPWIMSAPAIYSTAKAKFGVGSLDTGAQANERYVYAEASEDFSLGADDFCIEFWVWTGGGDWYPFKYGSMSEGGSTQDERSGFFLRMAPNDAVLDFQIFVGTPGGFDRYQFITMLSNYSATWMWTEALPLIGPIHDEWVHYAVVRYGDVFQVYQNGLIVPTNLFVNGSYVGGNTLSVTMPNITTNGTGEAIGAFRIPQYQSS